MVLLLTLCLLIGHTLLLLYCKKRGKISAGNGSPVTKDESPILFYLNWTFHLICWVMTVCLLVYICFG
jgi:hypothetical protein